MRTDLTANRSSQALQNGEHVQRHVIGSWTTDGFDTTAGDLDFGMAASGFLRFSAVEGREMANGASIIVVDNIQ
jgi:hypothetical protein